MAVSPRLVGAGLALVLATDAFLVYGARVVHPVSSTEAVARYRSDPGPADGQGPPRGVYLYDTTGYSRVSSLGVRRTYPAVTARIVRGHACGWREEVPVFDEHVETYDHCGAAQTGFGTRLTYFLVPAVTSFACVAGGCGDDANDVTATVRESAVTAGSADVGGTARPCLRRTVTTVLRGSNTGAAVRRLCVAPSGLVLHEERSVSIAVRSRFVGLVQYTEQATFRLRSTQPLT
jgi:hypothetical protein